MSKKIAFVSVLVAVLCVGAVIYAADYQVSGLSFNGTLISASDADTLHLAGQEGLTPTICLQHGAGVDFEFEVFNNGSSVGRNTGTGPRTCSTVNTPGTVTVRVWTFRGTGPYSVTIQP